MDDVTVLAADSWPTNAELIADVARLGYLVADADTLDPTYGKGIWWKLWRPREDRFVTHSNDGTDFRCLNYPDESFDQIAFDPPYVAKGGRKTSGIKEFDRSYGLYDCPATPTLLQELIDDGLQEMDRLVRPKGIVLVKCMDYISSGKLWPGVHFTQTTAAELGLRVEDILLHVGRPGPQPPGRRQVHARRNLSTLLVLRKP